MKDIMKALAILLTPFALVVFAACGSDATTSANTTPPVTAAKHVEGSIEFDYAYVTMKCDGHGHRIYLAEGRGTAVVAVAVIEDSDCPREGTR